MIGNNVSHSKRRTKREFAPNLKEKKFWLESEKRFVTLTESDKEALIKYAFQLTDAQYTELTSWLTLDVEGGAGEVKFLLKGKTANTTGSLRSFEMYLYRSDLSAPKTRVYIRQDP